METKYETFLQSEIAKTDGEIKKHSDAIMTLQARKYALGDALDRFVGYLKEQESGR